MFQSPFDFILGYTTLNYYSGDATIEVFRQNATVLTHWTRLSLSPETDGLRATERTSRLA